jgi:pilus assembly protein CpaC
MLTPPADQTFSIPGAQGLGAAGVGGYSYTPPTPSQPFESYQFGPADLVSKSKVDASIEAFERAGLLRVLAEPNLTAVSGEAAKFLAGGEFPIPVGQDDGRVSIEFKPFGVGLAVTPVVLGAGRISLKLATEVSELTSEGAIVAETIVIPALQVRRAETTVEIPSGGALMMAGLIQERTRQALEGIPGAKDLPVFGSLFRSRDFISNETELVIIVTPYLVKATAPDKLRTPADGFAPANDFDAMFLGRLNQVYRSPASDVGETRLAGKTGFDIPEPSEPGAPTAERPRAGPQPTKPKKGSNRP